MDKLKQGIKQTVILGSTAATLEESKKASTTPKQMQSLIEEQKKLLRERSAKIQTLANETQTLNGQYTSVVSSSRRWLYGVALLTALVIFQSFQLYNAAQPIVITPEPIVVRYDGDVPKADLDAALTEKQEKQKLAEEYRTKFESEHRQLEQTQKQLDALAKVNKETAAKEQKEQERLRKELESTTQKVRDIESAQGMSQKEKDAKIHEQKEKAAQIEREN